MHRSTARIPRLLAGAAVPVVLVTAGCSFADSDDGGSRPTDSEPAPESSTPSVAPAKYDTLPKACDAIGTDTVKELVDKVKDASGEAVKSADTSLRSGCSWTGLAGFQWRWLDVSFQRYESDAAIGSGDERADKFYAKQLEAVEGTEGARNMKSSGLAGLGDQAQSFAYETTKDKQDYVNQTIVARSANVVVTVNYNGAGFEDSKKPASSDLLKGAEKATKEALAAVK